MRSGEDRPLSFEPRIFPVSPFPNARLSGFENQSDGNDTLDTVEDRQIERIYNKPRWKKAFDSEPHLIPMTSFTEFAYWGEMEGSAIDFSIKELPIFFAAAIALKPHIPLTSEPGFSLLTHIATKQMLGYHHRLIVILKPDVATRYLEPMSGEERFNFIIENRFQDDFQVQKRRNMAKGWEKRKSLQLKKLDNEASYVEAINKEGVQG